MQHFRIKPLTLTLVLDSVSAQLISQSLLPRNYAGLDVRLEDWVWDGCSAWEDGLDQYCLNVVPRPLASELVKR